MARTKKKKQEFEISGEKVKEEVKEMAGEASRRKLIVKDRKARKLIEMPLLFALVGTIFAPYLAIISLILFLLLGYTIAIERS